MKPVRNLKAISVDFPAAVHARFDIKRGRGKNGPRGTGRDPARGR